MATVTQNKARCRDNAGIRARRIIDIAGPASYATGGDPFTPGQAYLGDIEYFPDSIARNAAGTVYGVVYDYTNKKLIWYVLNTGSQVANATDLSGFSFRVEVAGKG